MRYRYVLFGLEHVTGSINLPNEMITVTILDWATDWVAKCGMLQAAAHALRPIGANDGNVRVMARRLGRSFYLRKEDPKHKQYGMLYAERGPGFFRMLDSTEDLDYGIVKAPGMKYDDADIEAIGTASRFEVATVTHCLTDLGIEWKDLLAPPGTHKEKS